MQQNLKNLQNQHAAHALQRLKAKYPQPVLYRIALIGIIQEYKANKTPTVNAVDSAVRKGASQADNIVMWIETDIDMGDLAAGLRNRTRRETNIKAITIIKDGKDKEYSREKLVSDGLKIRLADFK